MVPGSTPYRCDTVNGESEGTADVVVTISHDATADQVVHDSVTITDPNVSATGGNSYTVQEGSATLTNVVVATFSDPGNPTGTAEDAADYSASIAWGDGSTSAGTISNNNNST